MSKKDLTEIVCIIDKSGSMRGVANDAIGGFNNFLQEQRKLPGEARMTLCLFDEVYTILNNSAPLDEVVELSERNYTPGGFTSLFDSVGRTIDSVQNKHAELSEDLRPERVIVVIVTDGQENSSKEYKGLQIKEKIDALKGENWEFVFFGADESAFKESCTIGISKGLTRGYSMDSAVGIQSMYCDMSSAVSSYRCSAKVSLSSHDAETDKDGLVG